MSESFDNVVTSESELRDLYRMPTDGVRSKVLGSIDQHARTFIDASPFVLVGTSSPDGTADVSPKGGPAGFVVVLDDQRIEPDNPDNPDNHYGAASAGDHSACAGRVGAGFAEERIIDTQLLPGSFLQKNQFRLDGEVVAQPDF